MSAKDVRFSTDARDKMLRGVETLANAVRVTLGPRGRNVILDKSFGAPRITKDGVTVAKEIELDDKFENMGAQMVREVAQKTNDQAGDGTTTATVLAAAIVKEGVKSVAAGMNPMDLKRGIDIAVKAVVEDIKKRSKKVGSSAEVAQVGTISSNGDAAVGKMIADAMQKVGNEGVITVEEAKALETDVEIVEGMQFDRGYISPYFITNAEKMVAELEDAYVLLHEKKLSALQAMLPLLEAVVQSGKPLAHHRRGHRGRGAGHAGRQQAARRVESRRREGARLRRSPQGDARRHRHPDRRPAHRRGSRHQARERDAGDARPRQEDRDREGKDHDRRRRRQEKGHRRPRQSDQGADRGDHLRLRPREAARAARQARRRRRGDPRRRRHRDRGQGEEGPRRGRAQRHPRRGRGRHRAGRRRGALLRAKKAIGKLHNDNADVQAGINIVLKALETPLRQIAENSGVEGSIVVNKILESKSETYGFDAQTEEYVDMVEKGIVDPAKVVRAALQDAASVAGLLVTTEAMVAETAEGSAGHAGNAGRRRHGRDGLLSPSAPGILMFEVGQGRLRMAGWATKPIRKIKETKGAAEAAPFRYSRSLSRVGK